MYIIILFIKNPIKIDIPICSGIFNKYFEARSNNKKMENEGILGIILNSV